MTIIEQNVRTIGSFLPNILAALLILIVGWIVATIIAGVVKGALRRTNLDNRLARSMGGTGVGIERMIGTVVFWLLMLFVLIAFFQALDLPIVSTPLNLLLATILGFLPRLLSAAILIALAWVLATVLKRLVTGALTGFGIDRRLSGMVSDEDEATPGGTAPTAATTGSPTATPSSTATGGVSLASTLGEVVYWLVFLLFLPGILGTLDLGGILTPVQEMLNRIFGYLPNVAAAALILLVGWFVARIVQRIVTGLLAAAGVDRLGERVGLAQILGGQTLSGLLGLLVYIFILVPVLISALNALQIEAITRPATNMLNTFLAAIPNIFAAAVVLAISYVVGRLLASLVANLLAGLGFNVLPARLGLSSGPAAVGQRTPAEIVGSLVLVAIMLFASVEALRLLGFVVLADLLAQFIQLGGQILLGLIIFAVGLYLANLAESVVRSSGATNAELLGLAARVSILVLAGAMALRQMGLANEIVNLAFGLLLGAIAVAAAIAFGFGGREMAGRVLERWERRLEARQMGAVPPPPPSPPGPRPGMPPTI